MRLVVETGSGCRLGAVARNLFPLAALARFCAFLQDVPGRSLAALAQGAGVLVQAGATCFGSLVQGRSLAALVQAGVPFFAGRPWCVLFWCTQRQSRLPLRSQKLVPKAERPPKKAERWARASERRATLNPSQLFLVARVFLCSSGAF